MIEKRVTTRVVETAPNRSEEFEWVDGELRTLYIHDTKKSPMLPADEIARLSGLVQAGIAAEGVLNDESEHTTLKQKKELDSITEQGRQARNEIVLANTGLVFQWAAHYEGRGVEYLDLIQAGNIGLIRAAEKFDPSKGFTFATYAVNWIRSCISEEIHKSGRTIKIPLYQSAQLQKMRRILLEHSTMTGSEMSVDEIAVAMGKSTEEILELRSMEHRTISANTHVGVDEDKELSGFLTNSDEISVEEVALDNASESHIINAVRQLLVASTLDDRSKEIIRMEFGIGYDNPLSQREIKRRSGGNTNTIKTLSERAIEQLRVEASLFEMNKLLD